MSGILGLLHLDGGEIHRRDLAPMASFLEKRGPEGTHLWARGPVGLGHTRLATTPEALNEFLPLAHQPSGCAITADLRLDNRDELLSALGLRRQDPDTGDAGLVLHAYLRWGIRCVEHFRGDFAFAIWDPRRHQLFCARDHLGMKPFNYHHGPGKVFAFASSPVAVVAHEGVPYAVNMSRVADALLPELEGVDTTSTFFEDVYRLPPAHALLVSPDGLRTWRYWALDPDVELYLDEEESIEAFLDAFTKAVDARLRTVGPRVSMLSGGMDSNSIVAIAKELLAGRGEPPLVTVSAISNDPRCVESNAIRTVIAQGGIDAHTIAVENLSDVMPQLIELTATQEEPFDQHMTMIRAVYLKARMSGAVSVLDGAAGDTVLAEGAVIERLLRSGHLWTAATTAYGFQRFWRRPHHGATALTKATTRVMAPEGIVLKGRSRLLRHRVDQCIRESLIDPDLAEFARVHDRLMTLGETSLTPSMRATSSVQRALSIGHPFLVVGRERYERTASATGAEPRDPFMDLRVIHCALRLPDHVLTQGGWPKALLRRSMRGTVPDAVRWRVDKEHLGWSFTRRRVAADAAGLDQSRARARARMSGIVRSAKLDLLVRPHPSTTDDDWFDDLGTVDSLLRWSEGFSSRPRRASAPDKDLVS